MSGATGKNVLYIVADDYRNDMAAAYGQVQVSTPHLDALAGSALVFDRAYCQLARCAPSRHSFMTGRYPTQTRVLTSSPSFRGYHPQSDAWRSMPEHFKLSGWLTLGAGKIFPSNSDYDQPRSWSQERPYFPYTMQRCPGISDLRKLPQIVEPTGTWCALPGQLTQFIDHNLTVAALNVLDTVALRSQRGERQQPFFVMVGFIRPHGPWMVPAHAYRAASAVYDAASAPIASARGSAFPLNAPIVAAHSASLYPPPTRFNESGAGELPSGPGAAFKVDSDPLVPLDARLQRDVRRAYYASVHWMDEQVCTYSAWSNASAPHPMWRNHMPSSWDARVGGAIVGPPRHPWLYQRDDCGCAR